jgi:hypothetical protein
MKPFPVASRIRASLIAVGAGWLAVMIVAMPMQLVKICSGNIGGLPSLLWSFVAGALVWGWWTLAFVSGGWLCAALPLIALVRESWMLRHPQRSVGICAALGCLVVLLQFKVWELTRPGHSLGIRMFTLYSLLLVVFPAVSAAVYLRLIARMRTLP